MVGNGCKWPGPEEGAKVTQLLEPRKPQIPVKCFHIKRKARKVFFKRLSGHHRGMKFFAGWDQERFDSALDKEMRPLPNRKSPMVTYRISMIKKMCG